MMRGRTLSQEDPEKAARLRRRIQTDARLFRDHLPFLIYMAAHTLLLTNAGDPSLPNFLYSSIIDQHLQRDLEREKVINWHDGFCHMFSLSTKGDGNCLLHALSLAMWGVHDTQVTLRGLLSTALQLQPDRGAYYQRFRAQRARELNPFQLNSGEWEMEWQSVVDAAKIPSDTKDGYYCALESIHIFVLANILRRPIVVVSACSVRNIMNERISQNLMQGIYLPLLWKSGDCIKSPIVLSHHMNHFTAIVPYEPEPGEQRLVAIPLVKSDAVPLPMHYMTETERTKKDELLSQYMDVTQSPVKAANISVKGLPQEFDLLAEVGSDQPVAIGGHVTPSAPPAWLQSPAKKKTPKIESSNPRVLGVGATEQPASWVSSLNRLSMGPPSPVDNELQPGNGDHFGGETKLLSVMEIRCPVRGCTYQCSHNTYPFCHEHVHLRNAMGVSNGPHPPHDRHEAECVVESCRSRTTVSSHPYCHRHTPVTHSCHGPAHPHRTSEDLYPSRVEYANFGQKYEELKPISCASVNMPYCHVYRDRSPPKENPRIPSIPRQGSSSYYTSMTSTKCAAPNCMNNTSVHTGAYCYSHLDFAGRDCHENGYEINYMDSLMDNKCAVAGCHRNSSHNTHPYCHEHKNSGESSTSISEHAFPSLKGRQCASPNCVFFASEDTYPFCYKHHTERASGRRRSSEERHSWGGSLPTSPAERPSSVTGLDEGRRKQCAVSSCPFMGYITLSGLCTEHYNNRYELPHPGMLPCWQQQPTSPSSPPSYENHLAKNVKCKWPNCQERGLDVNNGLCWNCFSRKSLIQSQKPLRVKVQHSITLPRTAEPRGFAVGDQSFYKVMQEVEDRSRSVTTQCRNQYCTNYGNCSKKGFCNSCFAQMQVYSP